MTLSTFRRAAIGLAVCAALSMDRHSINGFVNDIC